MTDGLKAGLTIAGMLAAMVAILFAAYYTTRFLGKQYGGPGLAKNSRFQIADKIVLGKNQYLCVVRIAQKTLLISVTQNNISLLCELEDYQIGAEEGGDKSAANLFYQNFLNELKKRRGRKSAGTRGETGNEEVKSEVQKENGDC